MGSIEFTRAERQQLASLGISEDQVRRQLAIFQQPPFFQTLVRPCTPGDGIRRIAPEEMAKYLTLHQEAAGAGRFSKFVPASGAATRRLREWEGQQQVPPTPVIALTAYALKEEIQKSLDAGCTLHLTKPIKKNVLLEAITQSVGVREERD